jgi:hypothetical protein
MEQSKRGLSEKEQLWSASTTPGPVVTAFYSYGPLTREADHEIAAPVSGRISSCTGAGIRPTKSADRSVAKGRDHQ